jgi:type II secretory pathway component PulJ
MMRRLRGISLVEVVIAMAVGIAMLSVLAATVAKMVHASAASREHLQTVATLGRLGEQFRRDAHLAQIATIDDAGDGPARLELAGEAGRTIRYDITPSGLQRVAAAAGEPERRELFVLPGMKFLGWTMDEDHREVSLAVGRLARPASENEVLRGQFSLTAALAKAAAASPAP